MDYAYVRQSDFAQKVIVYIELLVSSIRSTTSWKANRHWANEGAFLEQ
jgi:hypothetical protein